MTKLFKIIICFIKFLLYFALVNIDFLIIIKGDIHEQSRLN